MKQFLMKRMQDTFGDARITAGRMASLELAISVTPAPSSPGVMLFHRDFTFDMAKPLSEWEMKLARIFWLANFPDDPPPGSSAPMTESPWASKIRDALRQGCVSGEVAAATWIGNADVSRLEILPFTDNNSFFILYLAPDFKLAQGIANEVNKRWNNHGTPYYERDESGKVIGTAIFVDDAGGFVNFVRSYYHGELCNATR
jgi:hypothetical protein